MSSQGYTRVLRRVLHEINDVLPHYAKPDTWLTAIRVLLCFILPLIISTSMSYIVEGAHMRDLFGAALGAGMIALADPRGSTERRSVTILGSVVGGLIFYSFGRLVAGHMLGVLALCCSIGFCIGYMQNFGMAGVRAAFFWLSSAFMGSTATTTSPLMNHADILAGGVLALIMALSFFKTPSWQRKTLKTRLRDSKHNLLNDLKMATPAGRMAYRIMIASGCAVALVYLLGLSRAEWASASAIALFFPKSSVIYKRGLRYIMSCFIAIILCFLFITYVHNFYILAFSVGLLLFLSTSLREVNYAGFMLCYTMFFVLVIMMGTNIGGVDLLRIRITNVALGLCVGLVVASLTLSARERMCLLVDLHLPLPTKEHIDDPYLAKVRAHQVISQVFHQGKENFDHIIDLWMEGYDVHRYSSLERKRILEPKRVLKELKAEELKAGELRAEELRAQESNEQKLPTDEPRRDELKEVCVPQDNNPQQDSDTYQDIDIHQDSSTHQDSDTQR